MRFGADDFQGLTPSVDPRRAEKLFALSGKNYVLDSFGPRSVFGDRYLTPYPVGQPQWVEGKRLHLRTGDRCFHFTSDSILEWSESSGGWRVIYSFPAIPEHMYRWTGDYLDGIMFFCHPAVGLLAYRVDEDICLPLQGPGVPSQPIAICVCSGRLAVIDEKALTWSAPGDGTNFVPELGGAGFQLVNARVPGYPIMLNSYARGLLVWTTGGVMRSEFTADSSVFRHRALVTEYRPINSFCTFRLDNDTIGFLDERGIFQSQGESPRPLTPLFNEFLIDYLKRNKMSLGNNVRLEFDELSRRLYLSVSLSESNPLFEKAFVLYTPLDKWGEFNETHYGIHPVLIKDSSRAGDYYGFTDSGGRVRYWNEGASRETVPTSGRLNSYYPLLQQPAVQEPGGEAVLLASSMTINSIPTTDYTQRAGFYNVVGLSPAASAVVDLDSEVRLGYIRLKSDDSYDRLTEISQIYVGSVLANPQLVPVTDFNLIPAGVSDEDYNTGVGTTDYGVEPVNYANHGLRVIGTLDGRSDWFVETPDLIRFNEASREYSCGTVALFHIIEFSATQVGEAYHIRALELSAIDAGRLN